MLFFLVRGNFVGILRMMNTPRSPNQTPASLQSSTFASETNRRHRDRYTYANGGEHESNVIIAESALASP